MLGGKNTLYFWGSTMDYLDSLTEKCKKKVTELFPWEVIEQPFERQDTLIVDVREPYEYSVGHIKNSINVPRGILETASNFGYRRYGTGAGQRQGQKNCPCLSLWKAQLMGGLHHAGIGF